MESASTAVSGGGAAAVSAVATGTTPGYPASVDSSPRSRGGDSWDEPFPPTAAATAATSRLRLMCSYGGRIVPRPTDKALCYLGGETRMVVVDRHSSLADLSAKLSRDLLGGLPFSLKYQLPNEDLDSLISVSTDEDLENMIEEIDRISASVATGGDGNTSGSTRSPRLRLFLFPSKSGSSRSSSIESLLDESKSETWFVYALNSATGGLGMDGIPRVASSDSASVNCLLGLEDDSSIHSRGGGGGGGAHPEPEQLVLPRPDSLGKLSRHGQDVHSVPDSPMLDTTSSFGSASSAPSLANLPPIPVPTDDRRADQRVAGLEDNLAQIRIYAPRHQPPAPIPLSATSPSATTISPTENSNRVFSDDERSEHGGHHRPPQPPKPTQIDALSSDPASRPAHLIPNSGAEISSDPSYHAPLPVADAPSYVFPKMQPEQLQPQQSNPQLHQQHSQFIAANSQYFHHPGSGTMLSMPSYYPIAVHPMQQSSQAHSFNPQTPMYFVPVHHSTQFPSAAVQQNLADLSSMSTSGNPAEPVPRALAKPDLPVNSYRTVAPAPATLQPQLIHVGSNQAHPYAGMGYHVMQHPHLSQSTVTMGNYGYEVVAAPSHPQMYYSQVSAQPASASQYQKQYQTGNSTAAIADAAPPGDSNTPRAS
ncbi:SH3 domain-containing protein C23A1.17-like isoform X1 [Canna indica]|uniref:SH3 domain-containing protein C23A1.17-like isoform X1 n=1 Tax=Canna indica TaxID=4628 RepID=A0AAQ3JYN7_9LILI|nr:SH3 domain-containing protein C23A1.17-like isoform X1 [Canna indica]